MMIVLAIGALLAGVMLGAILDKRRTRKLATKRDVETLRVGVRHDQIVLTRLLRDEIRKKT